MERRSKEEQLERSYKIIEEQAKELVEKYEWNVNHVNSVKNSLMKHAKKEVEFWHDTEDCSGSWNLAIWAQHLRTNTKCNFAELKEIDENKAYELRNFVSELVDSFKYIENIELDELNFIAEYELGEPKIGIMVADGKYLIWSLDEIQQATEKRGMFAVVKRMYIQVLEKNKIVK